MPRVRQRTRLHMLADAISSLDKATDCLLAIDLRSLTAEAEVRDEIWEARARAMEARDVARRAYQAAATAGLKQLA